MKVWIQALAATVLAVGAASAAIGQTSTPPVSLGPVVYRVGNSVLFTVHERLDPEGRALFIASHLAACDGSWVSSAIGWSSINDSSLTLRQQQAHLLAEMQKPKKLPVAMLDWSSDIGMELSGHRSRVLSSCKSAQPAPRNTLVPITNADERVHSIVLGTVSRKGNMMEMWVNEARYRERPTLLDGKPYIRDGVEVTHAAFTGQTKLTRQIHNCAERSVSMTAVTEYDDSGKVINSISRDRSQAEFFEAVPGSIGEELLDFVCKVF